MESFALERTLMQSDVWLESSTPAVVCHFPLAVGLDPELGAIHIMEEGQRRLPTSQGRGRRACVKSGSNAGCTLIQWRT